MEFAEGVMDAAREDFQTAAKLVVIKSPKTVALDRSNYFAWRTQFVGAMRGNRLLPYLFGEALLDTPIAVRQDQLILSWILSSTIASVITEVENCETAADC